MKLSSLTSFPLRESLAAAVHNRARRSGSVPGWQERVGKWVGAAIGLVAPPKCAFCGKEDQPWGGFKSVTPHLCGDCLDAVSTPRGNQCVRCGAPVGPYIDARGGCIHCRTDRFQFETVIRLGNYRSHLGNMCLATKRPRSEELAASLAAALWQSEEPRLRGVCTNLVIPLPHHWRENVAASPHAPETLAGVLARRLRVDLATHILAKIRRTEKQSELPPSRRRTNLKGAFRVPTRFHSDLQGRRVLLVDDVLTTGATANEAARALLAAKVSFVAVAVIARGLGKKPFPGPSV